MCVWVCGGWIHGLWVPNNRDPSLQDTHFLAVEPTKLLPFMVTNYTYADVEEDGASSAVSKTNATVLHLFTI